MRSLRVRGRLARGIPLVAAALLSAPGSYYAAQGAAAPAEKTTAPAQSATENTPSGLRQAQELELKGVPNFGRVTPTLYRGAQPKPEGYAELKRLGIEIVVNFRDQRGKIEAERRAVETLGLRYVSIPWSGRNNPDNRQVAEFLELVRANPEKKFFVHCRHGADRTGVMVAAFRIALQNWTAPQAVEEMNAFHYHHFWYPHLRRYVEGFPRLLASDPHLRRFEPATHPRAP